MNMQTPNAIMQDYHQVMPTADGVLGGLMRILDKVNGWISAGAKFISSIFGKNPISDALNAVSTGIQKFQQLMRKLQEIVQKLAEILKGIAMPFILPQYADRWQQISDKYGQVSEGIGPDGLRAPGNADWTGRAATQYQIASGQYCAAAAFASATAAAHSARLSEAATQGQQLYMAIGALIVSIILAIIGVATKSGTIIGIPAAVAQAIFEVAKHGLAIAGIVMQFKAFIKKQEAGVEAIKAELEASTDHFPNGVWRPLANVG